MMLFHEIYGSYYNAVSAILKETLEGGIGEKRMKEIINEKAFSESFLAIIPALKEQKWQLLLDDFSTPLKHIPTMPLTLLQKRWLKAISLDKRIRLFDVDFSFLSDTEPLFTEDDFVVFDKYNDGDNFEDEKYIAHFRTCLTAIKEKKKVRIKYLSAKGNFSIIEGSPYKLEYSEKDDKFRVLLSMRKDAQIILLGGIEKVEIVGDSQEKRLKYAVWRKKHFTLTLIDERNALERVLLHFAHFEKEAEKIGDKKYRIKIYYDLSDETELVIRVLSFGPFIEVTEPQSFRNLIIERLNKQKSFDLRGF